MCAQLGGLASAGGLSLLVPGSHPYSKAVEVAGWGIAVIVDRTMKMLSVEDSLGAPSRSPLPAGVPIPHLLCVLAANSSQLLLLQGVVLGQAGATLLPQPYSKQLRSD